MHYGIDVGGTKTEFATFDRTFTRVNSQRTGTQTTNYEEFLQTLRNQVSEADLSHGSECSIGVGINGILNQEGRSFSVNVPCINGRQVQKDLSELIGRDVRCINDVHAFAVSEARGGAAEGYTTMVGMILGTGTASGYCRDGILQTGVDGISGEWGHLPIAAPLIERHGLPIFDCSCGQTGCLERYISGPGMARLAGHFLGNEVSSVECVTRMRNGDQSATAVFEIWIELVASVVAQLVLHSNPDVIVIGGGLSNIEELYDQLPRAANQFMLKGISPPPIRRARFGDASGVRGAAIIGCEV